MSKIHQTKELVMAVNSVIKHNPELQKEISSGFEMLKNAFKNKGLSLNKLGDFKYNTYYPKSKTIDLDLAVVKYFPTEENSSIVSINKQVISCLEQLPLKYDVKKNQNYFIVSQVVKHVTIKFRLIVMVRKYVNKSSLATKFGVTQKKLKHEYEKEFNLWKQINVVDKKDKARQMQICQDIEIKQKTLNKLVQKYQVIQDYVNINGIVQEDLALQITESFVHANKISNGTLFAIKKVLNYVLKNQFKYTYNVDMILLTWFYEFFARSLNVFLDKKYNKAEKTLNVLEFNTEKKLKLWFLQNINLYDLYFFIFSKFGQSNTYFFAQINFDDYELFKDISRYSLNTNSTFKIPSSAYLGFDIFDLSNYNDLSFIQENLDLENGFSKICYDKTRNEEGRYFASPKIYSGVANYPTFAKWLEQTATNLKTKLSDEDKKAIETFRSREAMEAINAIGHNWLASYWAKLKYLSPYFDKKYPLASEFDFKKMILMLTAMVDKTNEKSWILKNDN